MTHARTILVGDIHGCAQEFDDILERTRYAQGVDRLVLVGDLVARGPDSVGVIDRALRYGAQAVRGNHDEKVLAWWRVARAHGEKRANDTVRLSERHRAVVESMQDHHFEHLEGLPLRIPMPEHGLVVVHAGVDPTRDPPDTDPEILLTVRSIDADGRPTRKLDGTPWARAWKGPAHVVFGHDARRGLQLETHATGLDTGCCYGRELTALVLDAGEPVPGDTAERAKRLVASAARAVWCPMGTGEGPE